MAKVKAPLLSMRASGTIGKNIVFASWRGVPYTRQHVIPANPRTVGQDNTREVFSFLNNLYRIFGAIGLAPWAAAAAGRPFTGRNACIKSNLSNLRLAVTLTNLMGSPGVLGGPGLASFTPNPGPLNSNIDFDFGVGTLPTGWTLNKVAGFAVKEMDPHAIVPVAYGEGSYVGIDPQTFLLGGRAPATQYACVGWAVYNRPDASLAYSPSQTVLVTTIA